MWFFFRGPAVATLLSLVPGHSCRASGNRSLLLFRHRAMGLCHASLEWASLAASGIGAMQPLVGFGLTSLDPAGFFLQPQGVRVVYCCVSEAKALVIQLVDANRP